MGRTSTMAQPALPSADAFGVEVKNEIKAMAGARTWM
jgi:hypothetical protein